jgi:Tfp pilus assembly protein PilF
MRTIALAVILAASTTAAQPLAVDAAIREVRKSIDSGHAREALATLEAIDKAGASKRDQARLWFYTARVREELGDEQSAVADYRRAVDLEPTFGAAMNNLAQLLVRRGDAAGAAALLKSAMALDDPRHLLYVDNYAAAAEKAGDIEAARKAYAEVAVVQLDNVAAQLNSIRLLDDPQRIAAALAKLAGRGEAAAAQSLALDLLAKPFDGRGKRALLSMVAGALAWQHIAPQRFDGNPVAARLANLRADPAIAAGVDELLLLVHGEVDAARYSWWRSPRDDRFAALIKDLGASWAVAGDKKKAESYYKLALDYAGGADAEAFIELADLYYGQQRLADLDALARDYERPMFLAKSEVIAAHDYGAEYRFHVALGTMYAYLERWGDERDPTSAIFQLTQAQRAAADYNRELKWGAKIAVDPKTVGLLATGYTKVNKADRAVALRIDSAAAYAAEGRKTAANGLLAPFKADPSLIADAAYRRRYDEVTEKLKQPMSVDITISFPDRIDVELKSVGQGGLSDPATVKGIVNALSEFVTGETENERDRGEYKLLQLGVMNLNPATMSRSAGDFDIVVGGKTLKYHYAVSVK